MLCENVCLNGKSTIKTAEEYSVPLKTFEKWITSFNKDPHCFDDDKIKYDFHLVPSSFDDKIYDDMSTDELKKVLMKKDIELTCLKKGYAVKEGGLVPKEFVTFSKKI